MRRIGRNRRGCVVVGKVRPFGGGGGRLLTGLQAIVSFASKQDTKVVGLDVRCSLKHLRVGLRALLGTVKKKLKHEFVRFPLYHTHSFSMQKKKGWAGGDVVDFLRSSRRLAISPPTTSRVQVLGCSPLPFPQLQLKEAKGRRSSVPRSPPPETGVPLSSARRYGGGRVGEPRFSWSGV